MITSSSYISPIVLAKQRRIISFVSIRPIYLPWCEPSEMFCKSAKYLAQKIRHSRLHEFTFKKFTERFLVHNPKRSPTWMDIKWSNLLHHHHLLLLQRTTRTTTLSVIPLIVRFPPQPQNIFWRDEAKRILHSISVVESKPLWQVLVKLPITLSDFWYSTTILKGIRNALLTLPDWARWCHSLLNF